MHLLLLLLSVCLLAANTLAADAHLYDVGDEVEMLVNTVGPYSNPSETYPYYSLPFCEPTHVEQRKNTLGEVLEGSVKSTSMYEIRFGVDIQWKSLCQLTLSADDIDLFRDAIAKFYYFEMFYDDLPVWGFVGSVLKEEEDDDSADDDEDDEAAVLASLDADAGRQYYLFKHLDFTILHNGQRIVKVNCTADASKVVLLTRDTPDLNIEFSYSARWHETSWPYEKRMELYEDSFFAQELEIHWLSIMNSCVLVVLLTGFLALIVLRVLKSDYARYSRAADEEDDDADDYGWKLVHGDVFRFPPHTLVLCAYLGLGAQFMCMVTLILTLALLGLYYPNNGGAMYTTLIAVYAATSVVGGAVSGRLYKQMGGTNWSWNLLLQSTLFTGPLFVVVFAVNAVAWRWGATASLPWTTMVIVLMIWLLVGVPLCVLGGIAGKNTAGDFDAPVRTKNFPREIPHIPFYRRWYTQTLMSGFLPFSAIYIELFYVFSSIWGHSSYQLFGVLVVVFAILVIVVSCITVALTYFQLSMEDHRWWWSAFFCGGSVAGFVYAYGAFFFYFRSKMSGTLQTTFFFSYLGVIAYFFFILCASIGVFSSLTFVRKIYAQLKVD